MRIYLSHLGFARLLLPMLGVAVLQPVAILCWRTGPWSRGFPGGASLGGLGAPQGRDGGWRAGLPVPAVTPAPCPQETRLKEGIVKLKPHEEPLRSELLSGKFTILVGGGIPPPSYPNWAARPGSAPHRRPRVPWEPDPVSSPERAGPLGSLHCPLHGQAAPPQQERAARGAPGTLLPAGPSGGEVSLPPPRYRVVQRRVPGESLPSQGRGEMLLLAEVLMKSFQKASQGKGVPSLP